MNWKDKQKLENTFEIIVIRSLGVLSCITAGMLFWYAKAFEIGSITIVAFIFLIIGFPIIFVNKENGNRFREIAKSIVMVLCLCGFLCATWMFCRDVTSISWPITQAKVIKASSYEIQRSRFRPSWWYLEVVYTYKVNGVEYRYDYDSYKDTAGFLNVYRSEKDADQMIQKRFRPGTVIFVHYNPKNPSQSFFVPKVFSKNDLFWFIVIVGLITWRVIVVYRRKQRSNLIGQK